MATLADVRYSIQAGADAVGFVCAKPTSIRTIDINSVKPIASVVQPPKETFLLTTEATAQAISEKVLLAGVTTVQILSYLSPQEYQKLRTLLPGKKLVQVVNIESGSAIDFIETHTPYVEAFLLDSGKPSLTTPEYGGTGRIHDWSLSAEFVRKCIHPVYLAGGLTPENVGEAIRVVRPFGVDLCTGVRTNNNLDKNKLRRFIDAVHKVDADHND